MLIDPSRIQAISKTNERTEAIEAVKKYKMKLAEKPTNSKRESLSH